MIVAVSMFKDEADIAERTVMHLLSQGVDLIVVADNGSTDLTGEILHGLAEEGYPLEVIDDPEIGYYQSEKMTKLCHRAMGYGADWVLPFDADEVWYGAEGTIADSLADLDADVVAAAGWDHISTSHDPAGHPFDVMRWRRLHPQSMPKVAFRPHADMLLGQGNHDVARQMFKRDRYNSTALQFRHFQWRSLEQFVRKVRNGKAAYDATDLPETMGVHWRTFGAMSYRQLEQEWEAMGSDPTLVFDPAPVWRPAQPEAFQ